MLRLAVVAHSFSFFKKKSVLIVVIISVLISIAPSMLTIMC